MTNSRRWFRRASAMLLVGSTLLAGELLQAAPLLAQSSPPRVRPPASPESRLEYEREQAALRSAERAARHDLARFLNIRRRDVQISENASTTRETWPDSCLGLPEPDEVCTEAIVQGWRITVLTGGRAWEYRTDLTGMQVRRAGEIEEVGRWSQQAIDRVFQLITVHFDVPVERLQIAEIKEGYWDGCLGVSELDEPCALVGISGWRIVATDGSQRWVYHTDHDASGVVFNPSESQISQRDPLVPVLISFRDFSEEQLAPNVVFQSIASGGFAGDRVEVTLFDDGRIVSQSRLHGQSESRVSSQQVEQFRQLLSNRQFDLFSSLNYAAAPGSAGIISVMLRSPTGIVQYADSMQDRLPSALRQVVEVWNRDMVQVGQTAQLNNGYGTRLIARVE